MATDPDDLELSDVEETALFLEEVDAFEHEVRGELADGVGHVTERRQKRRLRNRAKRDD